MSEIKASVDHNPQHVLNRNHLEPLIERINKNETRTNEIERELFYVKQDVQQLRNECSFQFTEIISNISAHIDGDREILDKLDLSSIESRVERRKIRGMLVIVIFVCLTAVVAGITDFGTGIGVIAQSLGATSDEAKTAEAFGLWTLIASIIAFLGKSILERLFSAFSKAAMSEERKVQ